MLYILFTGNTYLVLSRFLSITRLTDTSIMTASADTLGEFFIRILHHGSYSFMISIVRVGITKKKIIVCAINSRFDKLLEGLAYIQKIRLLLVDGNSRLT